MKRSLKKMISGALVAAMLITNSITFVAFAEEQYTEENPETLVSDMGIMPLGLSDTEPPVFTGITADKTTVSPGDKIKFQIFASDDISGVNEASIKFTNKNLLTPKEISIRFNSSLETQYTVPQYIVGGTYELQSVFIYDNAGNG